MAAASSSSSSTSIRPQWSLLPTELLDLISQNLTVPPDFIRFRCVCRSWRLAANPLRLPPQLPLLLLPYDPAVSSRSFFSLATTATFTLDLPETRHQTICGSSNGWFLMLDETLGLSLFNPLTRSQVHLPPLPNRSYFLGFLEASDDDEEFDITEFYDCYAFVAPNPESTNIVDGIVAFVPLGEPRIQYWRPGDAGWTAVDTGLKQGGVKTMAFHKGKFFIIGSNGETTICDLGISPREATVIPSLKLDKHFPDCLFCQFLVPFCDTLLLITCHKEYINDNYFVFSEMVFKYHRLEEIEGRMVWSRVKGVGDCSLFVTDGMGHDRGRLMSIASDAPAHKRDFMYFVVPPRYCRKGLSLMHLLVKDEDGGIERYYGPWTDLEPQPMSSSWIVPSLC